MRLGRNFVTDAHVRTGVVVEMDVTTYHVAGLFHALKMFLAVNPFLLDDAVHPLGNGIVRRLVVFRHADGYMMLLKHRYIIVATILHAAVGMMDQAFQGVSSFRCVSLFYGLLQSLQGDGGA